nr:putative mitochondrial protein [Tanacetum cinerariifolium]
MNYCSPNVMTNKKITELDAEFIEYNAEAKASVDALEKNIDDGIGKLDASFKAMKEESDAKFEELKVDPQAAVDREIRHMMGTNQRGEREHRGLEQIKQETDSLPGNNSRRIGSSVRCLFEKLACQLVEVPDTVMEATFTKGLKPALRAAVRVMNPEVRQTTSKGDNFIRMTELEIQDRKAKGLCFRCEEKYTPDHRCASRTLQVMMVDESDEVEEPDLNFKS